MDNFMISFIILLCSTFLSRIINERANKKLSQEHKIALMDLFSSSRIYTSGLLIVITVAYFTGVRSNIVSPTILSSLYIISMTLFIIITSIQSYKKLKANDFPDNYTRSYITSTTVRFIGMIVFFILVWR